MKGLPWSPLASARPGRAPGLVRLVALSGLGLLLLVGCRSTQSDPDRPGLRVRPGVAFEMAVDAPDMPVLDLRRPDEFDGPLGHLPRAWNLPLEELPRRLPEIRWMQGVTFLIYCRGYEWNGPPAVESDMPEELVEGTGEPPGTALTAAEDTEKSPEEGTVESAIESAESLEETPAASGEERPARTPDSGAGPEPERRRRSRTYLDACGEEAIRFLLGQGFEDAVLLEGGIAAWLDDGYSTVGRGGQGPYMDLPDDPGLRVPPGAKSIGDPRYLPEPP